MNPSNITEKSFKLSFEINSICLWKVFNRNASIGDKSFFNNAGFYFAYNMGSAYDGMVNLTPLLGLQAINIRNSDADLTFNDVIAPQGFELSWNHALGKKNFLVVFGTFLSPGNTVDYKNFWIRWGKGMFWELNYTISNLVLRIQGFLFPTPYLMVFIG